MFRIEKEGFTLSFRSPAKPEQVWLCSRLFLIFRLTSANYSRSAKLKTSFGFALTYS